MSEQHSVIVELSIVDWCIVKLLQKDFTLRQIFERSQKVISFIAKESNYSDEIIITEQTTDGVFQILIAFNDQINLTSRYIREISFLSYIRSIFSRCLGREYSVELMCGEDLISDLTRLTNKYNFNPNQYNGLLNIGLRIFFEIYWGKAKKENIFFLNGEEIKGVFPKQT